MRFFLDVEATQPENEIISIGVVTENGESFYSLVRPSFSEVSPLVAELTGIGEELKWASEINVVLKYLNKWILARCGSYIDAQFYSYGEDIYYFKATLPMVETEKGFQCMVAIIAKLEDASKKVFKYFQGTISLINAYNYINATDYEQAHNALSDAQMLREVIHYIEENDPLEARPVFLTAGHSAGEITGELPHGTFYISNSKKSKSTMRLGDINDAIDWVIQGLNESERELVHKNRVALKIMKAVRKKESYCGMYWSREKGEKK